MGDAMDVDMEAVDDRRWDARAYDDDDDVLDAAPMDVDEDLVRCALASISALRRAPTACGDDLLNAHEMTLALSSSDEGGVMSTGMLPAVPRSSPLATAPTVPSSPSCPTPTRSSVAAARLFANSSSDSVPRLASASSSPSRARWCRSSTVSSRAGTRTASAEGPRLLASRGASIAPSRARLEEQREALQSAPQSAPTPQLASLAVQGPGDAGKMRLAMRAEGGAAYASGDEEIVFFAQARVRRGEIVALFTADVNAAVTARSHASEDDVPVATFDPNDAPVDADALFAATSRFYDAAATERGAMERGAVAARGPTRRPSHARRHPSTRRHPTSRRHPSTRRILARSSSLRRQPRVPSFASRTPPPSNSARSVLTALDDGVVPRGDAHAARRAG